MSGGEFFISANRANLGSEAAVKMGIWDISGGTATTAKGLNVARQAGCTAKLRLSGSGKLVTADIIGEVGASTVEFDGGTLVATNVAANGVFLNGIKNVVFGANAVAIDTAGHGLGIANCVLKATPGARVVKLLPNALPPRYDPSAEDSREIAAGRLLLLSGCPDTSAIASRDMRRDPAAAHEFRRNCLAMNELAAALCKK